VDNLALHKFADTVRLTFESGMLDVAGVSLVADTLLVVVLASLLIRQGICCSSVMVSALRVLLALNRCHSGKVMLETVVPR
jgi:hypothetical protein